MTTTNPEAPEWEKLDGKSLVDQIQRYAITNGISDIHTAPEKNNVRLEVRQHGEMIFLGHILPKNYIDFVRRIKFFSKLKLNVTNFPQDGQYTIQADDRVVNVRVATMPSRFGQKLTLRLLDPKRGIVPLADLGFPTEIAKTLDELVRLPNGMILVTGPTGSGKTTTLYALLKQVIGTGRNIITLENPIEYEIEGIVQSQIDLDHEYDFEAGLKTSLRHDPDIILVGEIRDHQTAQTAVDAALTGHLVLATLHTNSSIEAITRFLAMGISPYTFAPALRGVLAQRLVRTLKPELQKKGVEFDPADHKSYDGRTIISEMLSISPEVRELILDQATSQEIEEIAKQQQFKSMRMWAEELAAKNITTQTEVMRVTI